MEIEGRITLLINRHYTEIEIEDENANIIFCKVMLTSEQLVAILSRQGSVECRLKLKGLDKLGKKHENKNFEFEIPEEFSNSRFENELTDIAIVNLQKQNMSEWIPEKYYRSQDSFFKKDNKFYARITIRRYI